MLFFSNIHQSEKKGNLAHHFKPQEPWTCWDTNRITLTSDRRGKEEEKAALPLPCRGQKMKLADAFCLSSLLANSELAALPSENFFTSYQLLLYPTYSTVF